MNCELIQNPKLKTQNLYILMWFKKNKMLCKKQLKNPKF